VKLPGPTHRNIYVRSQRAGQRVMEGVKRFITEKLKLKVNESKSAVAKPQERKFLGFSFTGGKELKRKIAPKAIDRFKDSRDHAEEQGEQHGADDGGVGAVYMRLARLFRLLRNPFGVEALIRGSGGACVAPFGGSGPQDASGMLNWSGGV
jgi:hypothetical protein